MQRTLAKEIKNLQVLIPGRCEGCICKVLILDLMSRRALT